MTRKFIYDHQFSLFDGLRYYFLKTYSAEKLHKIFIRILQKNIEFVTINNHFKNRVVTKMNSYLNNYRNKPKKLMITDKDIESAQRIKKDSVTVESKKTFVFLEPLWENVKKCMPEQGKHYDITFNNPYMEKIITIHSDWECSFVQTNELETNYKQIIFKKGDDTLVVDKEELCYFKKYVGRQFNMDEEIKEEVKEKEDNVNSPKHYKTDVGFECIECIQLTLSPEEFKGYLLGNAFKYIWRYKMKKNPQEDLKKANWYLNYYQNTFGSDDKNYNILEMTLHCLPEYDYELDRNS